MLIKTKLTIALLLCAASTAFACWVDVPLEKIIKESHVIVIGELTGISVADLLENEEQYQFDIAHITVEKVLRNRLGSRRIKSNDELPLAMPSVRNAVQMSTDIRYEVGQRGIWILEYKDDAFWATYPKDFQGMSKEREVREILAKDVYLQPTVNGMRFIR